MPAITAGADDALVIRDGELVGVEATLCRVRHSRHVRRPRLGRGCAFCTRAWTAWRGACSPKSRSSSSASPRQCATASFPLLMDTPADDRDQCDVLVVDELPGKAHTFEVVKWVKSHMPALPVIVLTPPNGADVGGAALDMGADEVVNKAGPYGRRLVATLHRLFLHRLAAEPAAAADPDGTELRALEEHGAQLEQALGAANSRIDELRQRYADLSAAQGFERAMRDRDRADLASVRQSLNDERDRRIVLEETLRRTEDRARARSTRSRPSGVRRAAVLNISWKWRPIACTSSRTKRRSCRRGWRRSLPSRLPSVTA